MYQPGLSFVKSKKYFNIELTSLKYFAPLFFVVFVLLAQFVLVNVVVAVLMKHLEETHKQVRMEGGGSWLEMFS